MTLLQLIYVSDAAPQLTEDGVTSMVAAAKQFNEDAGVTGALYYDASHFVQVLEGEDKALIQLYARILDDPRHSNVRTLAVRRIDERDFIQWGMGRVEHIDSGVGDFLGIDLALPQPWVNQDWQRLTNAFLGQVIR